MEHPAPQSLRGGLTPVPVAEHRGPRAGPGPVDGRGDTNLTRLTRGDLPVVVIDDHHPDRVEGVTGAVGPGREVRTFPGHPGRGLGQAVADGGRSAELLPPGGPQRRRRVTGTDDGLGQRGQVVTCHPRVGHQVVGQGRDQGDPVDALFPDVGGQTHGVRSVQQDGGGAPEVRPQWSQGENVQDGESQHRAVPFVVPGRRRGTAGDARPQQVVLGVHGTLGASRSPRGVGDSRRGVGVHVDSRRGPTGGHQVGPRTRPVAGIDSERLEIARSDGPIRTGDEQGGPGVLQHPPGLRRSQVGVDAQPDGPQTLDSQERLNDSRNVGKRQSDPITRLDTESGQTTGRCRHPLVQLGVGQGEFPPHESLPVRVLDQPPVKAGGHRGRPLRKGRRSRAVHQTLMVHSGSSVRHKRRG